MDVLVVEVEDAERRSASPAQSERLPEAVLPEPCYSTFQNVVNNRCLLVSIQSIIASDEDGALARCRLIRKIYPWAASTRTPP